MHMIECQSFMPNLNTFDHSDLKPGLVTEFMLYLCGGLSRYWKEPVYLALNES